MTKNDIENNLKQILFERLDIKPEQVTLGTTLREGLGIDSFGTVEIIFEIKDKFGVLIKDEDARGIVKFSDLVDYVFKYLKKG